jgi:ParB family chromosome partitioning protein
MSKAEQIKVNKIRVPDVMVRQIGDEAFIEELANSIRTYGLLQDIVVRPVERGFYELVAGLRRLAAVKTLGWITIHAKVINPNDAEAFAMSFVENYFKEEMTALETAYAYDHLIGKHKYSAKSLVGFGLARNEGTVRRYLQLVKEPEPIQDMLKISELGDPPAISEYHVRMSRSGKLNDEERVRVLHKAVREGLTGTQIMHVAEAVDNAIDGERRDKLILDIPYSSEVHDGHNEMKRTLREQKKEDKPKVKPPEEEEEKETTNEERLLAAIELCKYEEEDDSSVLKNRIVMIKSLLEGIDLK